jgi:hypothetical protein
LLAASTSAIVDADPGQPDDDLNRTTLGGAEGHAPLDGISAVAQNELTEYRLARQRAATDEVMQNLHETGIQVRDSTEGSLVDADIPVDEAYALVIRAAALRSGMDHQPLDVPHSVVPEGGMILLVPTDDANEGVYELVVEHAVDDDSFLPLGMDTPIGDESVVTVAAQIGAPTVADEADSHIGPIVVRVAVQPETSAISRPSQQQAAMLVGTGVVLGAARWCRRKWTRKDRELDSSHQIDSAASTAFDLP